MARPACACMMRLFPMRRPPRQVCPRCRSTVPGPGNSATIPCEWWRTCRRLRRLRPTRPGEPLKTSSTETSAGPKRDRSPQRHRRGAPAPHQNLDQQALDAVGDGLKTSGRQREQAKGHEQPWRHHALIDLHELRVEFDPVAVGLAARRPCQALAADDAAVAEPRPVAAIARGELAGAAVVQLDDAALREADDRIVGRGCAHEEACVREMPFAFLLAGQGRARRLVLRLKPHRQTDSC